MGTEEQIFHVGFNQDFECFACGTSVSFRVFNCSPFQETVWSVLYKQIPLPLSRGSYPCLADLSTLQQSTRGHRDRRAAIQMQRASISWRWPHPQIPHKQGLCESIPDAWRCHWIHASIHATLHFPPRFVRPQVMMWDDHQQKCVGELSFRSQVRAVRLRRDRVVVALGKPEGKQQGSPLAEWIAIPFLNVWVCFPCLLSGVITFCHRAQSTRVQLCGLQAAAPDRDACKSQGTGRDIISSRKHRASMSRIAYRTGDPGECLHAC